MSVPTKKNPLGILNRVVEESRSGVWLYDYDHTLLLSQGFLCSYDISNGQQLECYTGGGIKYISVSSGDITQNHGTGQGIYISFGTIYNINNGETRDVYVISGEIINSAFLKNITIDSSGICTNQRGFASNVSIINRGTLLNTSGSIYNITGNTNVNIYNYYSVITHMRMSDGFLYNLSGSIYDCSVVTISGTNSGDIYGFTYSRGYISNARGYISDAKLADSGSMLNISGTIDNIIVSSAGNLYNTSGLISNIYLSHRCLANNTYNGTMDNITAYGSSGIIRNYSGVMSNVTISGTSMVVTNYYSQNGIYNLTNLNNVTISNYSSGRMYNIDMTSGYIYNSSDCYMSNVNLASNAWLSNYRGTIELLSVGPSATVINSYGTILRVVSEAGCVISNYSGTITYQ